MQDNYIHQIVLAVFEMIFGKEIITMNNKKNPFFSVLFPILGAVVIVAGAVAYICFKLAEEMRYNEKWKDYDECGWH